jgi:hypothetical protein
MLELSRSTSSDQATRSWHLYDDIVDAARMPLPDFSLIEWPVDPFVDHSADLLELLRPKRKREDGDDDMITPRKSLLCFHRKACENRLQYIEDHYTDILFANLSPSPEGDGIGDLYLDVKMKPSRQSEGTLEATQSIPSLLFSMKQPAPSVKSECSELIPVNLAEQCIESLPTTSKPLQTKAKGRIPYNDVEKKYRQKLNNQFDALQRTVRTSNSDALDVTNGYDTQTTRDGRFSGRRRRKSTVLINATAYILQLEEDNARIKIQIQDIKRNI